MALPLNELQAAVAEAESALAAAQQKLAGVRYGTTAHGKFQNEVRRATTQLARAQRSVAAFVDPATTAAQQATHAAEMARLEALTPETIAGREAIAGEKAAFQKAEAGAQAARVQAGELSVMEQSRVNALMRNRSMTYEDAVRSVRGIDVAEAETVAKAKAPKATEVPIDPDTGKPYKGQHEATRSTRAAIKRHGLDPKLGEVSKRKLSPVEIARLELDDEARIAKQLQSRPKGLEPDYRARSEAHRLASDPGPTGEGRKPYVMKRDRPGRGRGRPKHMQSVANWTAAEKGRAIHLITDPNSEFYGQQIDDVLAQMKQRRTQQLGIGGGKSRTGVLGPSRGSGLGPASRGPEVTRALLAENEALRQVTRGVPQPDPMARPRALKAQGLGPEALGRGRSKGLLPGTPMPTQGRAPISPGGIPSAGAPHLPSWLTGGKPIPPPGRLTGTYMWPAGTPQPGWAGGGGVLSPAQDARLAAQLGEGVGYAQAHPMGGFGQQRLALQPFPPKAGGYPTLPPPPPAAALKPPVPPNPSLPSSQIPGQQSMVSGMGKPLAGFRHQPLPPSTGRAPASTALARVDDVFDRPQKSLHLGPGERFGRSPGRTPAIAMGPAGSTGHPGYGGRTPRGFELAVRGEMGMESWREPRFSNTGTHTAKEAQAAWNAADKAKGKWGFNFASAETNTWLGGLKNKEFRNPKAIFGKSFGAEGGLFGKGAAATKTAPAVPAGALGKYAPVRGAFAGLNAIGPTWLVGSLTSGVNQIHPEGSFADQVVEGAQIGTAIGASFGPWGMAMGATAGVALNVITGGLLGNVIQSLPLVGGAFFGGSEGPSDEEQMRETVMAAYTAAAQNQGYVSKHGEEGSKPNVAAAATETLIGLSEMQKAGLMPATADIFMIAGRMSGFEGFPWEPEAAEPVYSAADINKMAEGMQQYLQPEQFVLDIVGGTDFDHIKDDEARASLEQWKAWTLSSLSTGLAATAMQPLTTAMTTSQGLQGQQQAGFDQEWAAGPGAAASFEDLLAGSLS